MKEDFILGLECSQRDLATFTKLLPNAHDDGERRLIETKISATKDEIKRLELVLSRLQ